MTNGKNKYIESFNYKKYIFGNFRHLIENQTTKTNKKIFRHLFENEK